MASATFDLVKLAIENRQQVLGDYGGHHREMCPHAVGYKNGREQALFYQFAGTSTKGLPPGGEWRCLPLAGLSSAQVRSGDWHTADQHSERQTCIDLVVAEVDY